MRRKPKYFFTWLRYYQHHQCTTFWKRTIKLLLMPIFSHITFFFADIKSFKMVQLTNSAQNNESRSILSYSRRVSASVPIAARVATVVPCDSGRNSSTKTKSQKSVSPDASASGSRGTANPATAQRWKPISKIQIDQNDADEMTNRSSAVVFSWNKEKSILKLTMTLQSFANWVSPFWWWF